MQSPDPARVDAAKVERDAQTWAGIGMEMNTRDADASYYEEFFTGFQNGVEIQTYSKAFAGISGQRALEVGCGTGRTLGVMSGSAVFGIDLSRKELLIAKQRFGAQAALIQASATHLPFKESVFDQILCAGVLQHLPSDEMRELTIQEMGRVLARPSRVVIGAHNYPWVVQQMFPKKVITHNLFWHRLSVDDMESMLLRAMSPCKITTKAICHLPRWRIGNRLGRFGIWLDGLLSEVPGLKHVTGAILVAQVDTLPRRQAAGGSRHAAGTGILSLRGARGR